MNAYAWLAQRADRPVGRQPMQRVDGKDDIRVAARIGQVVRKMRCAQVGRRRSRIDDAKRQIVTIVERNLTRRVDPAGTDQPDVALGEWFCHVRPRWRRHVVNPLIRPIPERAVLITRALDVVDRRSGAGHRPIVSEGRELALHALGARHHANSTLHLLQFLVPGTNLIHTHSQGAGHRRSSDAD